MTTPIIITTTRRDVFSTAWALVRKSGLRFADALRKAWAGIKLKLSLATTDDKGKWVDFVKTDGTTRHILATRNPAHIPAAQHPKGGTKPASMLTVAFYDLFEGEWKCCRVDSLIA